MNGTPIVEALSKTKTKRFKVKHPKRKLFRCNDPLLSVFMWGVNHTVRELQHINVPVMLMPDDFRSFSKITIKNHAYNKENLPSNFKVKEYCPLVFRNLRERFGIDDAHFLRSLTVAPRPINPLRGGATYYLSSDRMYVIKTLSTEEVEEMHHFLKQYHPYVVDRHAKASTIWLKKMNLWNWIVECYKLYPKLLFWNSVTACWIESSRQSVTCIIFSWLFCKICLNCKFCYNDFNMYFFHTLSQILFPFRPFCPSTWPSTD